jgi:hypothetical protein
MRFEWNGHSVFVPDCLHEVALILLAETANDGDTVNREWLREEWLQRHPERAKARVVGNRVQGLLGTHDITVTLKALAQTGIIIRTETDITIVDRTALAEFAEAVRSSLVRGQLSEGGGSVK